MTLARLNLFHKSCQNLSRIFYFAVETIAQSLQLEK